MEGRSDFRKVGNEASVVLTQAYKRTTLAQVLRRGPVFDGFHFFWVCTDSMAADRESQELHLTLQELTFRWL